MPNRTRDYRKLRQQLEDELKSSRSSIGELDVESDELVRDSDQEGGVPTNHMADVGSNVYERERLMTIESEMRDRVTAIQDALERIDAGAYGDCRRCGRPIPMARLKIMPFTNYCVDCQEIVDKNENEMSVTEEQPLQA